MYTPNCIGFTQMTHVPTTINSKQRNLFSGNLPNNESCIDTEEYEASKSDKFQVIKSRKSNYFVVALLVIKIIKTENHKKLVQIKRLIIGGLLKQKF